MSRMWSFVIVSLLLTILSSCSGGGSSPILPGSPEGELGLTGATGQMERDASSHILWGFWQIVLNTQTMEIEVVPLRSASFHMNVSRILDKSAIGLRYRINSLNIPARLLDFDVTITHPVPDSNLRGFDVRGILMGPGNTVVSETDPALIYNALNGTRLLNADGYTRWWNAVEFTDTGLFGYDDSQVIPGFLIPTTTLNPYKYFSDPLDPTDPVVPGVNESNRGTFSTDGTPPSLTRNYLVHFPPINGTPVLGFHYAIDASWTIPTGNSPAPKPIEDFPPQANCPEAFHIQVNTDNSTVWYEGPERNGGSLVLDIEVFDWQAAGNPEGIADEISGISIESPTLCDPYYVQPMMAMQGTDATSGVYHVTIPNVHPTDVMGQEILVTVKSKWPNSYAPPFNGSDYPESAALAAYALVEVPVLAAEPQGITLSSPNGGEHWAAGKEYAIEWYASPAVENVMILLSGDSGASYPEAIVLSTDNDGAYEWYISPLIAPGGTYRIKVLDRDDTPNCDESGADFTILPQGQPAITVLSPNGGEHFVAGAFGEVDWEANPAIESVKIELSTDGGASYKYTVSPSAPNIGSFMLGPIPEFLVGDQNRIRVSDAAVPSVNDESDNDFIINPTGIYVVSPNGGEELGVGLPCDIYWSASASIESLKIDLIHDYSGEQTEIPIVDSVSNSLGHYTWPAIDAEAIGDSNRIRITEVGSPGTFDESDDDFIIKSKAIILQNPNGGEVWDISCSQLVQWQWAGYIPEVDIELSEVRSDVRSGIRLVDDRYLDLDTGERSVFSVDNPGEPTDAEIGYADNYGSDTPWRVWFPVPVYEVTDGTPYDMITLGYIEAREPSMAQDAEPRVYSAVEGRIFVLKTSEDKYAKLRIFDWGYDIYNGDDYALLEYAVFHNEPSAFNAMLGLNIANTGEYAIDSFDPFGLLDPSIWTSPFMLAQIHINSSSNPSLFDISDGYMKIPITLGILDDKIAFSMEDDADLDSIPDDVENLIGTDPNDRDTDHDAILDAYEIFGSSGGYDPYARIPDQDSDGIIAPLDTDDNGDFIHDGEDTDTDGDGIANYLEYYGYVYDWMYDKYLPWDGDIETTYYKSDPMRPSTDQDPYDDDVEVSGDGMDVSIRAPGDFPMVSAYPNIVVMLEHYEITLNETITLSNGGSIANETNWSKETINTHTVSHTTGWTFTGTVSGELGGGGGGGKKAGKVGASFSASYQNITTDSYTTGTVEREGGSIVSEENWNAATTTNPMEAAKIKLYLKVYNYGTACISNLVPTLNLRIGGRDVETFEPGNAQINTLAPGDAYPGPPGVYWVVDSIDTGTGIDNLYLTLDELKALECGAPVEVHLNQILGDVMIMNTEGVWESAGAWGDYEARIDSVCANVFLDPGDGRPVHYLVYADDSPSSPMVTLSDALCWIAGGYNDPDGYATIQYYDFNGEMQVKSLDGWDFVFDMHTFTEYEAARDEYEADPMNLGEEFNCFTSPLNPDSQVFGRAPRPDDDQGDPEPPHIYYAFLDYPSRTIRACVGDYSGNILVEFIEDPDNPSTVPITLNPSPSESMFYQYQLPPGYQYTDKEQLRVQTQDSAALVVVKDLFASMSIDEVKFDGNLRTLEAYISITGVAPITEVYVEDATNPNIDTELTWDPVYLCFKCETPAGYYSAPTTWRLRVTREGGQQATKPSSEWTVIVPKQVITSTMYTQYDWTATDTWEPCAVDFQTNVYYNKANNGWNPSEPWDTGDDPPIDYDMWLRWGYGYGSIKDTSSLYLFSQQHVGVYRINSLPKETWDGLTREDLEGYVYDYPASTSEAYSKLASAPGTAFFFRAQGDYVKLYITGASYDSKGWPSEWRKAWITITYVTFRDTTPNITRFTHDSNNHLIQVEVESDSQLTVNLTLPQSYCGSMNDDGSSGGTQYFSYVPDGYYYMTLSEDGSITDIFEYIRTNSLVAVSDTDGNLETCKPYKVLIPLLADDIPAPIDAGFDLDTGTSTGSGDDDIRLTSSDTFEISCDYFFSTEGPASFWDIPLSSITGVVWNTPPISVDLADVLGKTVYLRTNDNRYAKLIIIEDGDLILHYMYVVYRNQDDPHFDGY